MAEDRTPVAVAASPPIIASVATPVIVSVAGLVATSVGVPVAASVDDTVAASVGCTVGTSVHGTVVGSFGVGTSVDAPVVACVVALFLVAVLVILSFTDPFTTSCPAPVVAFFVGPFAADLGCPRGGTLRLLHLLLLHPMELYQVTGIGTQLMREQGESTDSMLRIGRCAQSVDSWFPRANFAEEQKRYIYQSAGALGNFIPHCRNFTQSGHVVETLRLSRRTHMLVLALWLWSFDPSVGLSQCFHFTIFGFFPSQPVWSRLCFIVVISDDNRLVGGKSVVCEGKVSY